MAIRMRKGPYAQFDKSKMVSGEIAIVLDHGNPIGEIYFCISPGNVKQLATLDDLQALLDTSGTAYSALQQLITDLNNNPSELTNILNNISALQSGKFDKANIVQTSTVNDPTKVNSTAVIYSLANSITVLNDNLVYNDWTTITSFANGWAGSLKYRKTGQGKVLIEATLVAGTVAIPTNISNLPAGYRPTSPFAALLPVIDNDSVFRGRYFIIGASGNMNTSGTQAFTTGTMYYIKASYDI